MFPAAMSNSTSLSGEASVSSGTRVQEFGGLNPVVSTISPQQPHKIKKKRSLPGNPDPDAEVIALSPKTLLATNRFVCEICNKGFQRDQNLQLHRRGHNLPWKLKQRNSKEIKKKAYVCPEPSCVHHHPSRALGDLTGIKKHYCRKHGEKKWKCEKCSKIYAVQSDWKAHSKTCGTREYRCDCGTLFSRKDSFITHRAFCDALAEESARLSANQLATTTNPVTIQPLFPFNPNPPQSITQISLTPWDPHQNPNPNSSNNNNNSAQTQNPLQIKPEVQHFQIPNNPQFFQDGGHKGGLVTSPYQNLRVNTQHASNAATSAQLSATALLQKAATVGATASTGAQQAQSVGHMAHGLAMTEFGMLGHTIDTVSHHIPTEFLGGLASGDLATWQKRDRLTRDFLGLTGDGNGGHGPPHGTGNGALNVSVNVKDMLTYSGSVEFHPPYERNHHHSLLKTQAFGFAAEAAAAAAASDTWADC